MVTLHLEGQEIQLPPEIAVSDDAVRKAIAPLFPQAAHATIQRTTDTDGKTTIKLTKQAGTKGTYHDILRHLTECPRHVNPAVALYQELQVETSTASKSIETVLHEQKQIRSAIACGEAEHTHTLAITRRLKNTPGTPSEILPTGF
ncbi:MAG: hypothetical protein H8K06_12070 [Nitrospira sp.]|nr:hypothetical protein [Nitrospira sp.]